MSQHSPDGEQKKPDIAEDDPDRRNDETENEVIIDPEPTVVSCPIAARFTQQTQLLCNLQGAQHIESSYSTMVLVVLK